MVNVKIAAVIALNAIAGMNTVGLKLQSAEKDESHREGA
jgi:hypothetical protein